MQYSNRFSALYFRDFRLFITGQLISLSGTWMQSVAQGWLVYSLTKSPFYLGMVAAANSLPILFFTLLGGLFADRYPKRKLLLVTQALSILPAVALGYLTGHGEITVLHVAVLAAVLGTINAIDIPVRQSFLAEMVGKGHITNAIALNSAAFNGSRIIGPVIAGVVISYFGIAACFYFNAFSYVAVLVALYRIEAKGEVRGSSEGIFNDLNNGMQFIIKDREILGIFMIVAIFSIIGLPYISLLPVFAGEMFDKGAGGLGFLVGASGIGAFSAAIMIASRRDIKNKQTFMSATALIFSIGLFLFSISKNFALSLAIIMICGWGMVSYLATANSFIQLRVPDELRGRVMSVYSLVFLGTVPIGNGIMGIVADYVGTPTAVSVAGIICFCVAAVFSIYIRNVNHESVS